VSVLWSGFGALMIVACMTTANSGANVTVKLEEIEPDLLQYLRAVDIWDYQVGIKGLGVFVTLRGLKCLALLCSYFVSLKTNLIVACRTLSRRYIPTVQVCSQIKLCR